MPSLDRDNLILALSESFISWTTFWKIVDRVELEDLPKKLDYLESLGVIRKNTYRILSSIDWSKDRKGELEKRGIGYITFYDPNYPSKLNRIKHPPYVIFYRGNVELLKLPMVGIVGSRKATKLGREFTRDEASNIASKGYVVVSGFAQGIDTEAHEGALISGKTVACFGTSCDDVYPRQNFRLYDRMLSSGNLVISPFYRSLSRKFVFPLRNSIISALSDYLVVVEAGEKSGAMITAFYAFEMGVPVYAVPGKPWDPSSKGTNRLIKMGARLYESYRDLGIEDTENLVVKGKYDNYPRDLPNGTFTVEDYADIRGIEVEEAQVILMELELMGFVTKVAPGIYMATDRG